MELKKTPEDFLREIQEEKSKQGKGHLKIFFGYAAGVGKTYTMLEMAHAACKRGVDVVAGYIEPHSRPETMGLLMGLEVLPVKKVEYNNITLNEFDLDAAIERKPELVLVDELAHTNAPGCRHDKRFRDIKELLANGIDVYTTVNVQHIESLNDLVASITGITVKERIPDSVFDSADQVELVDIEPQDLLERLQSGKVYKRPQAERAVKNFFTLDNLTALREIALRRCADRVNLLTESNRLKKRGDVGVGEHILVCLSSAPSNPKIIRTAARMASAFRATFTALFVETPNFPAMSEENRNRLRKNIQLAKQLGAKIDTVYGDDVPYQIAEYARLSGVSKIVLGRSAAGKHKVFNKPNLTDWLIEAVPNMDVYIIPDVSNQNTVYREKKNLKAKERKLTLADAAKSIGLLALASIIGYIFDYLGFTEANIITVYIISVLLIAVITSQRIYSLVASVVSVLVFNFLYTEPRYSLESYDSGYPVTFVIMFLAALFASTLAIRLKRNANQAAKSAYRTKILFESNQLFQQATERNEISDAMAKQLNKLFEKDVIVYLTEDGVLGQPKIYPFKGDTISLDYKSQNEQAVVKWVLKNNKHAGATTNTLSNSKFLYLAIHVNDAVYGVVGIAMDKDGLDPYQNSILISILGECALALENEKNAREKKEAAILIENEQLRGNLLYAISCDLKKPLNSLSRSVGKLMSGTYEDDSVTRNMIYDAIYKDSQKLTNLADNLLSVTSVDDCKLKFDMKFEKLKSNINSQGYTYDS